MKEVATDKQGNSPSLGLLFKWGVEIKTYGLQPNDVESLIRHSFLVAHITKPTLIY